MRHDALEASVIFKDRIDYLRCGITVDLGPMRTNFAITIIQTQGRIPARKMERRLRETWAKG